MGVDGDVKPYQLTHALIVAYFVWPLYINNKQSCIDISWWKLVACLLFSVWTSKTQDCLYIRVEYSYFSCPSNDFRFPQIVNCSENCYGFFPV